MGLPHEHYSGNNQHNDDSTDFKTGRPVVRKDTFRFTQAMAGRQIDISPPVELFDVVAAGNEVLSMDNTMKLAQEVRKHTGIPVLCQVWVLTSQIPSRGCSVDMWPAFESIEHTMHTYVQASERKATELCLESTRQEPDPETRSRDDDLPLNLVDCYVQLVQGLIHINVLVQLDKVYERLMAHTLAERQAGFYALEDLAQDENKHDIVIDTLLKFLDYQNFDCEWCRKAESDFWRFPELSGLQMDGIDSSRCWHGRFWQKYSWLLVKQALALLGQLAGDKNEGYSRDTQGIDRKYRLCHR